MVPASTDRVLLDPIVSDSLRLSVLGVSCVTPARLKFGHHVANLTTTVVSSAAGLLLGGVVAYFGVWAIYSVLYSAGMVGRLSCGDGSVLAVLTLLAGANIGSVCGGIFGFAHRIYKPEGWHAY